MKNFLSKYLVNRKIILWAVSVVLLLFFSALLMNKILPGQLQPEISFSQDARDFGVVTQGETATLIFTLKNIGTGKLIIKQVKTSCGHTTVLLSSKNIPPGSESEIKATFNSSRCKGKQGNYIYVNSNDSVRPRVRLAITGFVEVPLPPVFEISPTSWDFGLVSEEDTPNTIVNVGNVGRQELVIKKVQGSLGCKTELLSPQALLPGDKGKIRITLDPMSGPGVVERHIVISSNDPNRPEVSFGIIGYVQGKSESHIKNDNTLWDFGVVSRGENPTHIFQIPNQSGTDAFIKITGRPGGLEARLLSSGKIAPGQAGKIEVSLGRTIPAGPIKRYVFFTVNGQMRRLVVAGYIKEDKLIASNKPIYLAYFHQPGCKNCDRVTSMLKKLKDKFPNLVVRKFANNLRESQELQEAISEISNLPEVLRLITPTVFIGTDHLVGYYITDAALYNLVRSYSKEGSPCPWEEAQAKTGQAGRKIIERFKSFSPLAIVIAGLLDGINPCAFTTLIFFISYLTFIGRKGREVMVVGSIFTFSVFVVYLLVGLGVFQFIKSLTIFSLLSRIFYFVTAGFALSLGILSLYDYYKYKKGKIEDMKLQLPKTMKHRIRTTIRNRSKMRNYLLAAFITGCLVSLLELACTGQVYLPTIIFVTRVANLRIHALLYLMLYNLMFILPLVVVFLLSAYGTTSEQLAKLMLRHVGKTKVAIALLFFGLAGLLILFLI